MRPNVRTSAVAIVKRFMGFVWRWTLSYCLDSWKSCDNPLAKELNIWDFNYGQTDVIFKQEVPVASIPKPSN